VDGCDSPVEERSKLIALAIWLPEQMATRQANAFLPLIFTVEVGYQFEKEKERTTHETTSRKQDLNDSKNKSCQEMSRTKKLFFPRSE